MLDEGRLFLEACGATGPLRFEWADPTTAELHGRDIEQAAFVVGHDPAADLVLDDPSVAPFHAFLQIVDGRLFAIDLGKTIGLRWGEIPRAAGWVNRGQPLRIGRYTLRLVGGDRDGGESIVEPAPTSSRYTSRMNLPRVVVEFRAATEGNDGPFQRDVLDRVLVLAGSSKRCQLRVEGDGVSRFTCALIRSPKGLWMTNVRPTAGATINGALCRFARLEDDDVVQIGNYCIRVTYNDMAKTPVLRAPDLQPFASLGPAIGPRAIEGTVAPADDLVPEVLLRPLLEQAGSELGLPSSPFGQSLVLLVRLLGDVHRDHLTLVRDELAEIRRLSRDMDRLRTEMQPPVPGQRPVPPAPGHAAVPPPAPAHAPVPPPASGHAFVPHTDAANGASPAAGFSSSQPEFEDVPRPSPEAVQEIVAERLEAWERSARAAGGSC